MDVKVWCQTLWEEHKLRKIFGPKKGEMGENCIMRNLKICASCQILLWLNQGKFDGQGMWHAWDRKNLHSILFKYLKERDCL
jgi:hypothetical protein